MGIPLLFIGHHLYLVATVLHAPFTPQRRQGFAATETSMPFALAGSGKVRWLIWKRLPSPLRSRLRHPEDDAGPTGAPVAPQPAGSSCLHLGHTAAEILAASVLYWKSSGNTSVLGIPLEAITCICVCYTPPCPPVGSLPLLRVKPRGSPPSRGKRFCIPPPTVPFLHCCRSCARKLTDERAL